MDPETTPRAPVVVLDEFLVVGEWRALIDYAFSRAAEFSDTQVIGDGGGAYVDHATRRSRVLYDLGPVHKVFADRLMTFLPQVLGRLRRPAFEVSWIEAQLTGTNHGEYFRMHTDNESHDVTSREVTFVYFFHREPRGFEGGELKIHDTRFDGGRAVADGGARLVAPLQNQVVFFPSRYLHEILQVRCPSGDFFDSRFTVNGWFHR
jgi:Rps23 Pro-64 3,4-dihydroxylase Tpa1-like proline 4-hydroxylase